jgi:hypothetical protein
MDMTHTDITGVRDPHQASSHAGRGVRGWRRRALVALCVVLLAGAVTMVGGGGAVLPAAAAAPACVFNHGVGAVGPLIVNITPGESINFDCTGFPASHPYLLIEASLLVAVDPAALPELNALSIAFPSSDSSGVLNYNYTVPTTQPLDPNATCPPSTVQLRSGLIGCAVAMIDLTSFKPVVVGTCVLSYKGQTLFQPDPTLQLSVAAAKKGQRVSVSDKPGATTYWWVATLASLVSNLGGGGGGATSFPVVVKAGRGKTVSNASVTPATYNGVTFTPPKLSGWFIAKGKGKVNVKVTLDASLLAFTLENAAQAKLIMIK